jgi:hypothetical protein
MRKGSIFDSLAVAASFLAFAMALLVGYTVLTQFQTTGNLEATANTSITTGLTAMGIFDGIGVFIIIAASLATIVSALFIDSHPVFFIISAIAQLFIIGLSTTFSNLYDQFASTSAFSTAAGEFPMIAAVIHNLPLITLVVSALTIMVMHGKGSRGGAGEY